MTVQIPGVGSAGMVSHLFVTAIQDITKPTVAELTSNTTVTDLSCYLDAKWGAVSVKQETEKDERYCSRQVFGTPGMETYDVDTLEYVVDPQAPTSVSSKAYKALTPGTTGFLVSRWGKDYEEAYAAGDLVDIVPVTAGAQSKVKGAGNSPLKVRQELFVTGKTVQDVTVIAGA